MAELKASGLSKQKQDAAADRLQQGVTIIGEEVKKKDADDMTSASSSVSSSTPPSPNASETDLKDIIKTTQQQHSAVGAKRRVKSLSERSKVPMSFYASMAIVCGLQCFSGMWQYETIESWAHSITQSAVTTYGLLEYLRDLCRSALDAGSSSSIEEDDGAKPTADYVRAVFVTALLFCVSYVFLIAPFRAGLWTGPRSRKHKLHRYMGLAFLLQYALAWVEFVTNYHGAKSSYVPHVIALNGTCTKPWISLAMILFCFSTSCTLFASSVPKACYKAGQRSSHSRYCPTFQMRGTTQTKPYCPDSSYTRTRSFP